MLRIGGRPTTRILGGGICLFLIAATLTPATSTRPAGATPLPPAAAIQSGQDQDQDHEIGAPRPVRGRALEAERRFERKLSPALRQRLRTAGRREKLPVIIRLVDPVEPTAAVQDEDGRRPPAARNRQRRNDKARQIVENMKTGAAEKRRNVEHVLARQQARGQSGPVEILWIVNGLRVDAVSALIRRLAGRPDVAAIDLDRPIAQLTSGPPAEPNLSAIGVPETWTHGTTGSGVTIGVIDSGADLSAAELAATWRGGTNSWIDYVSGGTTPIDPPSSLGVSHGTVATGVAVGGAQSGTAIGAAPDAQWIAARVFNQQQQASTADIHAAFQWMLDPDGNPATPDAPAVVNSSWSIVSGSCDLEFAADIQTLVAADILPVFAAGNAGTSSEGASPANYPDAFAVGAVDNAGARWDDLPFGASNRGPTSCGTSGASRTFPDIVAPGVNVKTVEGFAFYSVRSGTSIAAPHVSGVAALLLSEFPTLTVGQLRAALAAGATDLGPVGPDDEFGSGMVNVAAARSALLEGQIGDQVWSDTDGDGQFDQTESGLPGIGITLHGPGADTELGTTDDVLVAETATDPLGTYVFVGLGPGAYRVAVDESTVEPGSTLTSTANPIDLLLSPAEVLTDVDFGYSPSPPGSVAGTVWFDADQDGLVDGDEARAPAIGVQLVSPGQDQAFGTTDDVIEATVYSGADGGYTHQDTTPGTYQLIPLENGLPTGATSTTGGIRTVSIGPGQDLTSIDFGFLASTIEPIYLSFNQGGRLNDGDLRYSDEDILAWDGSSFTRFFDGSDVGLGSVDLDGFQVVDGNTIVFSVNNPITLADVGAVDDSDLIQFSGSVGPNTTGQFSMYLDASDVGLTTDAEDVDGIDILADGTILLSTRGPVRVPGLGLADGEDVLAFLPSSIGEDSAGLWANRFDGSDVGLDTGTEDLDAIDSDGIDLLVSTLGALSVPGLTGEDHDLFACGGWIGGPDTDCTWAPLLAGSQVGIGNRDIDGLTVRSEWPIDPPAGLGSWVLSLDRDGAVNGGALAVDELDVLDWGGSGFTMLFDASDLGITVGDLDALHHVDASTLLLSFDQDQTVDGLTIDDSDIVEFSGQLGPDTSGTFSIVFDGSDVGLLNNAGDIDGLLRQSDGSFVVSIRGNRWLPSVGVVQDRDLLHFAPTSVGETTAGTWSVLLDGFSQGLDTGAEDINAVTAADGAMAISTLLGAQIGSETFTSRGVIQCSPDGAGDCAWTGLLDGAALGLMGFGIDGIDRRP